MTVPTPASLINAQKRGLRRKKQRLVLEGEAIKGLANSEFILKTKAIKKSNQHYPPDTNKQGSPFIRPQDVGSFFGAAVPFETLKGTAETPPVDALVAELCSGDAYPKLRGQHESLLKFEPYVGGVESFLQSMCHAYDEDEKENYYTTPLPDIKSKSPPQIHFEFRDGLLSGRKRIKCAAGQKKVHAEDKVKEDNLGPYCAVHDNGSALRAKSSPFDQGPHPVEGIEMRKKRFDGDLYTPRWVRGSGLGREGFCELCDPGIWLRTKQSAYWYHMNFHHGISAVTGRPYEQPDALRELCIGSENGLNGRVEDRDKSPVPDSSCSMRPVPDDSCHVLSLEGHCKSCDSWVLISNRYVFGKEEQKASDVKNMNMLAWYRHVQKCLSSTRTQNNKLDQPFSAV